MRKCSSKTWKLCVTIMTHSKKSGKMKKICVWSLKGSTCKTIRITKRRSSFGWNSRENSTLCRQSIESWRLDMIGQLRSFTMLNSNWRERRMKPVSSLKSWLMSWWSRNGRRRWFRSCRTTRKSQKRNWRRRIWRFRTRRHSGPKSMMITRCSATPIKKVSRTLMKSRFAWKSRNKILNT